MRITKALWPLLIAALASACEKPPESMRPIVVSRTVERLGRDRPRGLAPKERFLLRSRAPEPGPGETGLVYNVPPGWTERPPRQMRKIDFQVGEHPEAECYLTILPGGAGGLVGNVNRWYRQMGVAELSSAQVEALPTARFLGFEATLVDIEGTFTTGGETHEGWRMVGLLWFHQEAGVFLKMTGPRDVVEAERGTFLKLAREMSLPGSDASDSVEPDPAARATSPAPQTELAWDVPEGWTPGPNRAMREVTLLAGDGDPVECYVTFLGPGAGMELANVNRWRAQLGLEPLAAIENETRIQMLGQDALLVDIQGDMGGQEGMMLGTIATLPDRSVFVKMMGPRAIVEPEKDAFVSFCKSLRLDR